MENEIKATWKALQELSAKYGYFYGNDLRLAMGYGDKVEVMAAHAQSAVESEGMADPHKAYTVWFRAVIRHYEIKVPHDPRFPYYSPPPRDGISRVSLHAFWKSWIKAGCSLDKMREDFEAIESLSSQFETVDSSDLTDRMYGRRTYVTRHKATGTLLSSYRDGEGSLGG